jgi:hypothetical protein
MEAPDAAHCWAPPLPSPPSELPQPRCLCATAAARRRLPQPIHRHQSITGEPNRSPPSLVCHPVPHLAAGEFAIAIVSKGGTKGLFVKVLKVLGGLVLKDSSQFCGLDQWLVNSISIRRKCKNSKPKFVVLSVTRTTTFSKYVYTFELQFLLEKYKCKIPRSVILQNPHKILRWILDMLWALVCVGPVPKNAQSYWRDLFI